MQPVDTIHAIAKKTGDIGASFYFTPETLARGKELGLDGFRFYGLGRGGVLGDVEADVVRSAFGYFHPAIIDRIWNSATVGARPASRAREYLALRPRSRSPEVRLDRRSRCLRRCCAQP